MSNEGTGIKQPDRLASFMSPITAYRTVAVADGPVDPDAVPNVPLIDNRASGRGINEMFVYADPQGGTATVQVWVVTGDDAWYLANTHDVGANVPGCWLVENLPATRYAIVVTACTEQVVLKHSFTK